MKRYDVYIGIDPGVQTGLGIWDAQDKKLIQVNTMQIHIAMERVVGWRSSRLKVRLEDARLRKFFGSSDREKLQGAGSIKRDCKIWEDFLTYHMIEFDLVAPKNNRTKLSVASFTRITGWKERTSNHARDAAMLVYGY